MMGPFRNHPIVLVRDLVVSVIIAVIVCLSFKDNDSKVIIWVCVVAALAAFNLLLVRIWKRTSFSFDDTGIAVNKNTLFKEDKTIPYSKVSSVNVVRSIWGRIAGTSTVQVNINSGVKAAIPEVVLELKKTDAENLRTYIEYRVHGVIEPAEEAVEYEYCTEINKVKFSNIDVIIHSLLINPTPSLFFSLIMFAYSVFGLMNPSANAPTIMPVVLFIISLVVPTLRQMITLFNFTVYRSGDIIHLEHGLLQKYESSFNVNRINAVRIKQPFFARLFGMSSLQAEVVGINARANDITPTLCLMSSEKRFNEMMNELIPEFIYDAEVIRQPAEARVPVFIKSILASVITIIAAVIILVVVASADITKILSIAIAAITVITAVILTVMFIVCSFKSLANKGIKFGKEKFTIIDGVVDRTTSILHYDRVQISTERSGPIARFFDLEVCQVSFLSSAGVGGNAKVGYLKKSDARKVADVVMTRLRDGSYDYRMNEI